VKVRYTYRLRPGEIAKAYLVREAGMCRFVWNQLVVKSKESYLEFKATGAAQDFGLKAQGKFLTELRRNTCDDAGVFWLKSGSSVAQQQAMRDFSQARSQALSGVCGFPKFKARNKSLPSLNYTKGSFSLKTHSNTGKLALVLPGKVMIPVVWSRELPSAPSSVRVFQDSLGHWYASFVVEEEFQPAPPVPDDWVLGCDPGIRTTITTARVNRRTGETNLSDGFDLPNSQHNKHAQSEVTKTARRMSRRFNKATQSQSHGYRLAKYQHAKAIKKAARTRKEEQRKWARTVALTHQTIAIEDYHPVPVAKDTKGRKAINRKSADGAVMQAIGELKWQTTKLGRNLITVPPAGTTQTCSTCGAKPKHHLKLNERMFNCETCGLKIHRDKNAAINCARAGLKP